MVNGAISTTVMLWPLLQFAVFGYFVYALIFLPHLMILQYMALICRIDASAVLMILPALTILHHAQLYVRSHVQVMLCCLCGGCFQLYGMKPVSV